MPLSPRGREGGPKAETREPGDRPASRLRACAGRGEPERRGETRMRAIDTLGRWSTRMRLYRALTALTLLSVTTARADDAPLTVPETVVTATRVPTPVENVAAGVTVIDRATIESHGYNTLTDALADVPGLHVSPSGGPGGQA